MAKRSALQTSPRRNAQLYVIPGLLAVTATPRPPHTPGQPNVYVPVPTTPAHPPPAQPPPAQATPCTKVAHSWSREEVSFLLNALLEQADCRKQAGGTFKPEAWQAVLDKLNKEFSLQLDLMQIKSKVNVLKMKLSACLKMRYLSGWGFNYATHALTNDKDVVRAYIADKQALARELTTVGLPDYDCLSILFSENIATGRLAKGSLIATAPAPGQLDCLV
ncbi:hypothetical protein HDU77_011567 [Chytriomyces hyalinus]|nr:hypothetical protein HDU77_011567 [Chytriomyces hyalinus]